MVGAENVGPLSVSLILFFLVRLPPRVPRGVLRAMKLKGCEKGDSKTDGWYDRGPHV